VQQQSQLPTPHTRQTYVTHQLTCSRPLMLVSTASMPCTLFTRVSSATGMGCGSGSSCLGRCLASAAAVELVWCCGACMPASASTSGCARACLQMQTSHVAAWPVKVTRVTACKFYSCSKRWRHLCAAELRWQTVTQRIARQMQHKVLHQLQLASHQHAAKSRLHCNAPT
jgi:hypothetical protein